MRNQFAGLGPFQRLIDGELDFIHGATGINDMKATGATVVFQHGGTGPAEGLQAAVDQLGMILGDRGEFAIAQVASASAGGRTQDGVVGLTALLADEPAGEALDDEFFGQIEQDGGIQTFAERGEEFVEETGLACGAGETVKEKVTAGFGFADVFLDHGFDDLVGDQFTGVHVFSGEQAEGGLAGDLIAEEVTGGEMLEIKRPGERGALGAFTGTRGTKEGDVHGIGEGWILIRT